MFTATLILLLTLAISFDVGSYTADNSQSTVSDVKDRYEMIIDGHECLLDGWHQIYSDSAILQVVNYFDSLNIVNSNSEVKWNKASGHHILGSICAANTDYTMAMEQFIISLK